MLREHESPAGRAVDHALQGIIRIPSLILSPQEFSRCPWIGRPKGDGKIEVMRSPAHPPSRNSKPAD
jgi:hypothetical protein